MNDAALLLLDHQTGLFQTVKDIPVDDLRANTLVLAKIGELAKIPIITTASEPNGPNGPLMSELESAAPSAKYVPRKGEVSAWDNADFVKAVEATGRKTLIMAGVWTSVCVMFPALDAKAGTVIGQLHRRHRSIEFRKFLDTIDGEVPADLDESRTKTRDPPMISR